MKQAVFSLWYKMKTGKCAIRETGILQSIAKAYLLHRKGLTFWIQLETRSKRMVWISRSPEMGLFKWEMDRCFRLGSPMRRRLVPWHQKGAASLPQMPGTFGRKPLTPCSKEP